MGLFSTEVETSNNPLKGTSLWYHRKACIRGFIISCVLFQFGLDYGCVGAAQAMVGFLEVFGYKDPASTNGYNLSTTVQQLFGSLLLAGGIVGGLTVWPIGHYLGRRHSLMLASVLSIIAMIIMLVCTDLGPIYFARILAGLANTLLACFSQMYLTETMPAQFRGQAFAFISFWQAIGSLIGSVITNSTQTIDGKAAYQIPFGICMVIPALMLIILPFFPETPRYLLLQGRDADAETALRRIRPSTIGDALIAQELQEMRDARDVERLEAFGKAGIIDMWQGTNLRRTMLCIACGLFQTCTGSTFLINYSTYFFLSAGLDQPFQDSIIISCAGLLGVIISFFVVRIAGRRIILQSGSWAQAICFLIIGIVYTVAPNSSAAGPCLIVFSFIYMASVNGTIVPYAFAVGLEIPETRHRAKTNACLTAVSYLATWLVSFTIPYFINPDSSSFIGPKYAFIFVPVNIIMALFIFFFLPETKDNTLEELDTKFLLKLPARQFSKYKAGNLVQTFEEIHGAKMDEKREAVTTTTEEAT